MKIKKHILPISLCLFLILYTGAWRWVDVSRKGVLSTDYIAYTTPSKIIGPVSMEFKGIVSDFLFLKLITSIGERIGEEKKLTFDHARYIYDSSDVITDLDPYFWDAYLFSSMVMAWDFGQYQKANSLLSKAMRFRETDYNPPYYIGFIYFYFLKNNETASEYLMKASRIPGCPPYIPPLATRLSVKALEHKTAIAFLEEIIKKTQNRSVAIQLQTRLKALIALDYLETKVDEFKDRFGQYPKNIAQLINKGLISDPPEDPYGGRFYIMENHRVFTTSNLRYQKNNQIKSNET